MAWPSAPCSTSGDFTRIISTNGPAEAMAIRENLDLIRENIEKACLRANRDPRQVQHPGRVQGAGAGKDPPGARPGRPPAGRKQEPGGRGAHAPFPGKEHRMALHRQPAEKQDQQHAELPSASSNRSTASSRWSTSTSASTSRSSVFIEINIGEEKNKSGFTIEGLKKAMPYIANLNKVNVSGLMAIPPYFEDTGKSQALFLPLARTGRRDQPHGRRPTCKSPTSPWA